LRGEIQLQGGHLVDVNRQRAVIAQVERHHRVVVGIGRVVLRMVIVDVERVNVFHVLLQQEAVDRGWNARRVVGKIIGIGIGLIAFGQHAIREAALRFGRVGIARGEVAQERKHFRRGIGCGVRRELIRGQLEIQERQRFADPLRVQGVNHFPRADRPVELRVARSPFLRAVQAEHDVIFRLETDVQHGFCGGQHQPDGTAVILKAPEVRVIVTAEENLEFGGLAADAPGDVVGCPLADFNGVIHLQCSQYSAVRQLRADFTACANADGAGWDARRAADILTVQRVVRNLPETADVRRENCSCALMLRFQHGVGNPPVGALVNIHQHDFALDIHTLIVIHCAAPDIDNRGGDAFGDGGCRGVGINRVFRAVHGEGCAVELPLIALRRRLFDVGQPNAAHFVREIIRRGVFRVAACLTTAVGGVIMEMEVSGEAVRDGIGVLGIGGAAERVVEGLQRASLMRGGGFVGTGARGQQQDADKQDEQENEHRKSLLMQ